MPHYFWFCSCESSSGMEISKDIYSTKAMVQKNTKSDLSRVFYLINWGFDYRQISSWNKFLITKKYISKIRKFEVSHTRWYLKCFCWSFQQYLKVVSATFLLVCFIREHLWNKEKCFPLHFKSSFRSWDNENVNFVDIQISWCH